MLPMGRASKIARGLITGWIQFFLNILLQIAFVPLILLYAGQETLGAYAIIIQVLGYLALVDFGLNVTTVRFLSHAYGKDDDGKEYFRIMSLSRVYLLATNFLFAMATLGASVWLKELFRFPPDMLKDVKICMYMIACWTIVRSPFAVYAGGLIASQRMATANIIYMVGNILRLAFSLGFILLGYGLKGLIAANIASEIVYTILFVYCFKRNFGTWRIGWKIRGDSLFKEVLSFSGHIFLINLSSLLIFSTGNIVVGSIFGVVAASVYYSTQFPATSGYNLILLVSKNATPAINELYGRNEYGTLRESYLNIQKYTNMLAFPFAFGLLVLNRSFIDLWVGHKQYGGDLMTWSLAGLSIIMCTGGACSAYVQAKGDIKGLSRMSIAEGLFNLSLSFLLGWLLGMGGVLLAMLVARVPTTVYVTYKSHKDLNVSLNEYVQKCILQPLYVTVTCGVILFLSVHIVPPHLWKNLIVNVALYMILYVGLCYRFVINDDEKSRIKGWINNSHRSPASV